MESIHKTVDEILETQSVKSPPLPESIQVKYLTPEEFYAYRRSLLKADFFVSAMGIPKRFHGKTLSKFDGHDTEKASALEAIHAGQSVIIVGGCGTGKTHLAVALALEWGRRNVPIRVTSGHGDSIPHNASCEIGWGFQKDFFLVCADLFVELKATFNSKSQYTEADIIKKYATLPFLILDDLGTEKTSEWTRTDLYALINARYNAMLPTIVTCNFGLGWISENVDDRLASRLSEMGDVITLKGEDKRVKK